MPLRQPPLHVCAPKPGGTPNFFLCPVFLAHPLPMGWLALTRGAPHGGLRLFFPPLLGSRRARRPALGLAGPRGDASSLLGLRATSRLGKASKQGWQGRENNERLGVLGAVGKGPPGRLPGRCLGAFSHSPAAESPAGGKRDGAGSALQTGFGRPCQAFTQSWIPPRQPAAGGLGARLGRRRFGQAALGKLPGLREVPSLPVAPWQGPHGAIPGVPVVPSLKERGALGDLCGSLLAPAGPGAHATCHELPQVSAWPLAGRSSLWVWGERTAPHGTSGGCRCHSVTSCPAAPRQELSLGSKSLSEEQRGSWGGAGVGDPQQQLWKKGLGPSTRTRGCQGKRRRQVPKMLLSPRAPGPAAPWDDGGNGRPASTRAPC